MSPFPPLGPIRSGSPASSVLWGHYDVSPPVLPRFVFLRLAIPFVACVHTLCSRKHPDASARGPGVSFSGNPFRLLKAWRQRDLPGSWMTPPHICPAHAPRSSRCARPFAAPRYCPRDRYHEDLNDCNLSRLNHTAFVVASYASCPGHPKATQGWLLAAGQLYQVGVLSHWVMQEGFKVLLLLSSFSRLTLARSDLLGKALSRDAVKLSHSARRGASWKGVLSLATIHLRLPPHVVSYFSSEQN